MAELVVAFHSVVNAPMKIETLIVQAPRRFDGVKAAQRLTQYSYLQDITSILFNICTFTR